MNCLSYALPLWHKYGGHLQLRKSKHLDVPHVVWIRPDGGMQHYVPKVTRKKSWRHLFLVCAGFDGEVRTSDDITPEPMRLRGLLLSAYIFAFVVTWFCIKELFIRLVEAINMKQVLIAIDQTVNTLVCAKDEGFGMADETISARAWRLQHRSAGGVARAIIDTVFFWEKDHCENSYRVELAGKHLPYEYGR